MTVSAAIPSAHPAGASSVTTAAAGTVGICLAAAALQVALAAGAPLGEHVWGGNQDRFLQTDMRLVAAGSAGVLTVMAAVVARRAGLIGRPTRRLGAATWGVAASLALNTVGNVASTSVVERFVFGPTTAVAATLTAFVAFRTQRTTAALVGTNGRSMTATRTSRGSGR